MKDVIYKICYITLHYKDGGAVALYNCNHKINLL